MQIGLVYNVLFLFMTMCLFIAGYYASNFKVNPIFISPQKGSYFGPCLLGISAFTLNEGLRFGRGIDYNHYFFVYKEIGMGYEDDKEFLFQCLVKLFNLLGIEYRGFILFTSCLFIFSLIVFFRKYRNLTMFVLPIAPLFLLWTENLIRQSIGVSFLFVGLSFLVGKKRYFWFVFFSVIGTLFHSTILIISLMFFIVFHFNSVILTPLYSVSIFFMSAIFFSNTFMAFLEPFFSLFLFTERFSGYADQFNYMIIEGGAMGGSRIPLLYSGIGLISLVGGYGLRNYFGKKYVPIYNSCIVGVLSIPFTNSIELLRRLFLPFEFFMVPVIAYILYHAFRVKKSISIYAVASLIFVGGYYVRMIVLPPFKAPYLYQYVWDRKGKDFLDISTFNEIWKKNK